MMNFKKNQNNAVCSMDCKNCPHGASQPNPMDDSMFEKSIAMLHNWLMLEAIREDHPKERIVMVILPGAGGELLTERLIHGVWKFSNGFNHRRKSCRISVGGMSVSRF